MQNILITGKNSYIGRSLILWMKNKNSETNIEELSLREDSWKERDFSKYDAIVHCAGIAHIKENKNIKDLYLKINKDLAVKVAQKAKSEGVKQFIFLSSFSIFGLVNSKHKIDTKTICNPNTFYGQSKYEAEKILQSLSSKKFKIVILRPPMVYGPNCKGNFVLLSKLAKITPIFPKVNNQRSMIFVYNLTELIRLIIENQSEGFFMPQNKEFVCTSDMVKQIAKVNGKKVILCRVLGFFINFFSFFKLVNKVFGNLVYEKQISNYFNNQYCVYSFEESIEISENIKSI